MTYRDRRAARADRLRGWADKRQTDVAASLAVDEANPARHDWAFITQPGHIPARAAMNNRDDKKIRLPSEDQIRLSDPQDQNLNRHTHFAPDGWEETDRAICPACGALVFWSVAVESWRVRRDLRVLVLTRAEAQAILTTLAEDDAEYRSHGDPTPATIDEIDLQLRLQEPIDG